MVRFRPITGDADWTTSINKFEPFNNGAEVITKVLSVTRHIINCKNGNSLYTFFSNPLRGN